MSNVDFNLLNAKLLKRLHNLCNYDPEEKFRLLKRYISHFVKLVQCGRHFETSFKEHLQLILSHINDRTKPIDVEALGVIVKTLCVICCITAAPHQLVIIAAQALLEIFERISYKETSDILQFCGNHFLKLMSHLSKFGHFKIQQLFIELVFASSQIFGTRTERQEYIQRISNICSMCLDPLLDWNSSRISAESRTLLMNLQDKSNGANVFSLPIERIQVDGYLFKKIDDADAFWLDFNFKPGTVSFCSSVAVLKGDNQHELQINLEIAHRDIIRIELKQCYVLEYKNIAIESGVLDIRKEGKILFEIPSHLNYGKFNRDIIPRVRKNITMETERSQQSLVRLEDLLNVSILESVASGFAPGKNSSKLDHSLRLRENRNIIEQHQNMRCRLLSDSSTERSNKENEKPHDLMRDVQPLNVFESLNNESLQQQIETKHASKRDYSELENISHEPKCNEKTLKKRKLFKVKEEEKDDLDSSKDSQIKRSKYVEKKLVNTVKPMNTYEMKPLDVLQEPTTEVVNESSTSEIMSSEEFDQSLRAYIKYNGIFGIKQQKVLDKKLEKNIRKINDMVDRTTKKFFKREPEPDNPYEFKDKSRKRTKTSSARKRNARPNRMSDDDEYLPNKSAKAKAKSASKGNTSNRKRTIQQSQPKPENVPPRVSLHRVKKPLRFIDITSDGSDRDDRTIQSSIDDKNDITLKETFEDLDKSSTNVPGSSEQRTGFENLLLGRKPTSSAVKNYEIQFEDLKRQEQETAKKLFNEKERSADVTRPAFLSEINSSSSMMPRNEKNLFQNDVTPFIEREKQTGNNFVDVSLLEDNMTADTSIELDNFARPISNKRNTPLRGTPTLTESLIKKHLSNTDSYNHISSSLEANISGGTVIAHNAIPDSSYENFASRFNLDYANKNYLLNKFISINDPTALVPMCNEDTKEANESIISKDMRVGNIEGPPPSSLYDSSDLLFVPENNPPKISGQRAEANCENRKKKIDDLRQEVLTKRRDRVSSHHDSSNDISLGNERKQTGLTLRKISYESGTTRSAAKPAEITFYDTMTDQFKLKIHQDLNPSLEEMEKKLKKLKDIDRTIENIQVNIQAEEIVQKCDEIKMLERRVEKLINDVTDMCTTSVERGSRAIGLSTKLVKYDKTKRQIYKLHIQGGRQEVPVIMDECVKGIWNQQVRGKLESFISKLMM
ncbi:uncharacterized protein LOC129778154 [Toxorhynchites rutilus septentrionalis]|uniref:uncharacterized protein LOC129778154 n=1 Tax=Toxorhynchites rutilus septentrionalis TaxID=329112 RepID=UPI00247ABF0E|nr:uncharacterized protein LOC129778154 [Toxorhynchites rutilus septentrionalis]